MALQTLRQHLFNNIVALDNKLFVQRRGIPQGSVLSSMLCNYYYGHLERHHLASFLASTTPSPITAAPAVAAAAAASSNSSSSTGSGRHRRKRKRPDGQVGPASRLQVLMRLTDDFLYIADESRAAQRFVQVGRVVASVPACCLLTSRRLLLTSVLQAEGGPWLFGLRLHGEPTQDSCELRCQGVQDPAVSLRPLDTKLHRRRKLVSLLSRRVPAALVWPPAQCPHHGHPRQL